MQTHHVSSCVREDAKGNETEITNKGGFGNVYDYFEELSRHKHTQGSLKQPLMPQDFHVLTSRG